MGAQDNKCPNYDKEQEEAPFGVQSVGSIHYTRAPSHRELPQGYRLPMRRKSELQQRQLMKQIAQGGLRMSAGRVADECGAGCG